MTMNAVRQYTIRNIPDRVDHILRQRAKTLGKSFNQVVLDAIVVGAGEKAAIRRDLDFMIGSMSKSEAARVEGEIRRQRTIDPEMWK